MIVNDCQWLSFSFSSRHRVKKYEVNVREEKLDMALYSWRAKIRTYCIADTRLLRTSHVCSTMLLLLLMLQVYPLPIPLTDHRYLRRGNVQRLRTTPSRLMTLAWVRWLFELLGHIVRYSRYTIYSPIRTVLFFEMDTRFSLSLLYVLTRRFHHFFASFQSPFRGTRYYCKLKSVSFFRVSTIPTR